MAAWGGFRLENRAGINRKIRLYPLFSRAADFVGACRPQIFSAPRCRMSSTLGGPPPQDEAAKVLPPEPALDSEKEAIGHEDVDLKSRSVQLSPSATSTDPGLTDEAEPHANGNYSEKGDLTAVVTNTEPQKAEEDSTIGNQSAIEESGPSATSHPEEAHQSDLKAQATSNDKEFTTQESGQNVQGPSEMEGEPSAATRAVYVTSQSTGTATPSTTGDNINKTHEDITQSPPMHIPPRRRVKVYALSAKTGAWDDRGTGCVDIRAWDTDVRSFTRASFFSEAPLPYCIWITTSRALLRATPRLFELEARQFATEPSSCLCIRSLPPLACPIASLRPMFIHSHPLFCALSTWLPSFLTFYFPRYFSASQPELCVISELDPSVPLLESPILADTAYHVQQGTTHRICPEILRYLHPLGLLALSNRVYLIADLIF